MKNRILQKHVSDRYIDRGPPFLPYWERWVEVTATNMKQALKSVLARKPKGKRIKIGSEEIEKFLDENRVIGLWTYAK